MSLTIGASLGALSDIAGVSDQIGIEMFKRGMDANTQVMSQLIQQMPPAPSPAHLGQGINTLA